MLSRLVRAVHTPASSMATRATGFPSAALRRAPRRAMNTGGQEPIPPTSNQGPGAKGAGVKPYDTPPVKQDGPPPGGFGTVKMRRDVGQSPNLPSAAFLLGSVVLLGYGLNAVGYSNRKKRVLNKEKDQARRSMCALLQAEEDARWVRRQDELDKREAEIMKNVPDASADDIEPSHARGNIGRRAGWEVGKSVYHGKKHFVQPYGSQFI